VGANTIIGRLHFSGLILLIFVFGLDWYHRACCLVDLMSFRKYFLIKVTV